MGWSNYIIIDEWKVMVEVPREINNDDYFNDGLTELLRHMEEVDYDLLEDKVEDMTIDTLSRIFETTRKVMFLSGDCGNVNIKLFLYFLNSKDISYRIEEPEKYEGKYKDYIKVKR